MRIGILTLPLNINYGGILQAYALQTVLERMGHEVWLINKIPYKKNVSWYKLIVRIFQKYILGRKDIHIFFERDFNKYNSPQSEMRVNTNRFIDEHIKIVSIYDINEIKPECYDAIVVGSDQIWRPKYLIEPFNDDVTPAFLSFATSWSINRVAYAASFGTDVWEYSDEETCKIKNLAKKFQAISVREDSGVRLCKENLGVEATHVLDPTMLLDEDDYNRIAQNGKTPNGDLMCYILDKSSYKNDVIAKVAKAKGLVPFNTNASDVIEVQPPVEDWLQGLKHAKMVITDSFHACVFSIIYHKPFIAISNDIRGNARLTSLLTMFGLEDRLIEEGKELNSKLINSPIDYVKVDKLLDEWRKKSSAFLKDNIKSTQR